MAPSLSSEIIYLVESGDDDDAEGASAAIASSSAAMKKKTTTKNGRDDRDDDDSVEFVGAAASPNHKPHQPPAAKKARIHHQHRGSSSSKETEGAVKDKVDAPEGEEEEPEEDRKPAAIVKKQNSKSKKTDAAALTRLEENDDDDDIQLVDAPHMVLEEPPKYVPPFASMPGHMKEADQDKEDEIAVVGTRHPRVRLPHMRQHCTIHPFCVSGTKILPPPLFFKRWQQNKAHCELCYCYVCDVPVRQCSEWWGHCDATDTGPERTSYQRLRKAKRLKKERRLLLNIPPPP
jgi:hypothetical protein